MMSRERCVCLFVPWGVHIGARAALGHAVAGVTPFSAKQMITKELPFVSEEEEIAVITENVRADSRSAARHASSDQPASARVDPFASEAVEVVVGRDVEPKLGLRVRMRGSLVDQGDGTVTMVNLKRGYVSVQWDSGRVDPLMYVGGTQTSSGMFFLAAASDQSKLHRWRLFVGVRCKMAVLSRASANRCHLLNPAGAGTASASEDAMSSPLRSSVPSDRASLLPEPFALSDA